MDCEDERKKQNNKQAWHRMLLRYSLLSGSVFLTSCASSPIAVSPDLMGENRSGIKKKFFFDGTDFVVNENKIPQKRAVFYQGKASNESAMPAVKGYHKTSAQINFGASGDVMDVSDATLKREYLQHRKALATANRAEQQALKYAREANQLKAASLNAHNKASKAGSSSKAQRQQAKQLQQKAVQQSRIAQEQRKRALMIKRKAEQAAKRAEQEYQEAKRAEKRAKEGAVLAKQEQRKGQRLQRQAQNEAKRKADKLQQRDQAIRNARALEVKAQRRTSKLRALMAQDETQRKLALKRAQEAQLKAKRIAARLAQGRSSVTRATLHEQALRSNK